jgi:hypothetical protein
VLVGLARSVDRDDHRARDAATSRDLGDHVGATAADDHDHEPAHRDRGVR